ncbi:MAG TPA: TniB family NTP-binding protein [Steroidobacteraceae bacterium]|nr:TniB family NTP-binding protein [Steroidobacteraceae bacterium]
MSKDYPHLHDSVRALLTESDESRIRRIRADRWVGYARADAALSAFEELLTFPKRTRMPNLLLCGPTNNGKSMVLQKFRRSHPPVAADVTSEGVASIPVLKIQMPPGPDERRFFGAILDALALPHGASESVSRRQDSALRHMQSTGVSLLIIDEAHNLLAGAQVQQRRMLNLLRWLGNELQIPIIAAGTAESLHAIQSDDQLANRFEPIALPRWGYSEEFRELLRTLEALLPLRRPSNLAKPALAQKVLAAAEGILGEVVAILTRAAVRAVTTGTEAITVEVIEACGFLSPSERRRVAV